jgi:hypothetical protein
MLKITLSTFLILFFACGSTKLDVFNNLVLTSDCPKEGKCTIDVLKNKSLVLKSLDNGGIYYDTISDNTKMVILYQYSKNMEQVTYDGGYREEIIFEVNSGVKTLNLNDKALQETKMIFGRYCNCRGKTGIYPVVSGKLNLTNLDGKVNLDLEYKISEVPQATKSFRVTNGKL